MSNDVKFLNIRIRNFFSYGNVVTTIDLSTPGCTLIQGTNLDDVANGVMANGTGKTTILRGMLYLYANYVSDDMMIGDIVNNINKKDCMVGGDVLVDGVKYTINKYRQSTEKPEKNYIEIFKNDDTSHNLAKGTAAEVAKQISTIIGIDPDIFPKIVMFDVNATPFFREKGPVQRAIMEELFGLNDLMHKAEQLSERVKISKNKIQEEEGNISVKQRLYDDYKRQIQSATDSINKWEIDHSNELDTINRQIAAASTVDINLIEQVLEFNANVDLQINKIVADIQSLKNEINLIDANHKNCKSSIDHLKRSFNTNYGLFGDNQKRIDTYNNSISVLESNKCPECHQGVQSEHSTSKISGYKLDIEKLSQANDKLLSDNTEMQQQMDAFKQQMDDFEAQKSEIEAKMVTLSKDIVKLNLTKRDIPYASVKTQQDLDRLRTVEIKLRATLDACKSKTNPYIEVLQRLEDNPQTPPDMSLMNELQKMYMHEQFLYKLMTDKKSFVRKHLIDKRLATLNKQIHFYLQKLGLPHTAIFNNDLTVTIARLGRPIPYGGLSGGQKARLDFSLCLAFRDLLQISNKSIPFLMVDEVLDHGLDDVGVQLASNVIHTIAKEQQCSVFLITHKSEIVNRFPQKIVVQFKDGFSNIVSEEE